MKWLPDATSSRIGLLVAFLVFLASRLLTLTAFPIFNDEAIYLQYSQKIHDDWSNNKYVSMQGEFDDWKPPLQYWMAAPVIDWGGDPLLAGRAVALLFSIAGFFGSYLVARELFGEREGTLAAALWVVCPPVLFHNNQFTAETFLFSAASLLYWVVLKATRQNNARWLWAVVGVALGAILLLLKQSAFLLLAVSTFLPLARLAPLEGKNEQWNWKQTVLNLCLVLGIILCARLAAGAFLPSDFDATRDRFNAKWVMSPAELLAFPVTTWQTNLRVVGDYIGSYFTWAVPVLLGVVAWFAIRRRSFADLALSLMCLAGALALTFLLRRFNEYLFNTAIIAVLLPLLARAGLVIYWLGRKGSEGVGRLVLLCLAATTLANWLYQDVLMTVSAGRYIERSTPWAINNYLRSWSTGFGVKEIVALLAKEKRPGVVFADTQWGNPGTALEVYNRKHFRNLRVVPVTKEFLDRDETRKLKDFVGRFGPVHLAIFSADSSEERDRWQANVRDEMCGTRTEIKAYPSQEPIVICQF